MTSKRIERRLDRRVALRLPIRIAGTHKSGRCFEFMTRTANLCRGGLALATRHPFDLGEQVEIIILQAPLSREKLFSTLGRIAHISINEETGKRIVGVHFEERLILGIEAFLQRFSPVYPHIAADYQEPR